MIAGTENMRPGMVVNRWGRSVFIELPYYVGYLGVPCWNCGLTNTTFEVYRRTIDTNCLSCARGSRRGEQHPVPAAIREWVKARFWIGGAA